MSLLSVGIANSTVGITLPTYTTATLPTGKFGKMVYDSTDRTIKIFDGSSWVGINNSSVEAEGGTISYKYGYKYHAFLGDNTFTVTKPGLVDLLIVAGGGGGSVRDGGGSGAGGVIHRQNYPIEIGSYSITIGAGGPTVFGPGHEYGSYGFDTTFGSLFTAVRGGRGGRYTAVGGPGGSGGGNGGNTSFTSAAGAGTLGQGFDGGWNNLGSSAPFTGGGGGGAGGCGENVYINEIGGDGGIGIELPSFDQWGTNASNGTTGTRGWFGGGGGGGGATTSGAGGIGGGGNGGNPSGVNAIANTGGGGGAARSSSGIGGQGGSGIVVVRYKI